MAKPVSSDADWGAVRLWRRGRNYGDFRVGDCYSHRWGRTITEADAILFATQSLAHNPRYFAKHHATPREDPSLIVSPYLVLAVVVGLSVEDLSERSEAFLGMERVEFGETVVPGDTLRAASRVSSVRRSASRPGFGVVTWSTIGSNQHDRVVVDLTRANLFRIDDAAV
jgi:acyl dehydratase